MNSDFQLHTNSTSLCGFWLKTSHATTSIHISTVDFSLLKNLLGVPTLIQNGNL